jgi:alpha-L-fucosidase
MLNWRDGKGDIMRDFVNSCRKFGIKPGVFTTTRFDNRLGINNSVPMKDAVITREQYNRLVESETEELLSRYGDLFELWLDGSARTPAQGGPDLLPIFEKHQPEASIFYHTDDRRDVRWGGTESGTVGDPCWSTVKDRSKMNWGTGSPDGAFWCPAMADSPLRSANGRHDWFWWPEAEKGVLPLNSLKNIYLNSVGRNATLVIGLTPDLSGLLPQPDVERCREFGAWLKETFGGEPLAKTSGTGTVLTLDLPPSAAKAELFVVLQEDIREGERVREYVLEREVDGVWTECRKGTNIGHKRIIRVKRQGADKLRLTIPKSAARPIIANFSAFTAQAGPAPAASGNRAMPLESGLCRSLGCAGVAMEAKGWHIWECSPLLTADGKVSLFVEGWPVAAALCDKGWRHDTEIPRNVSDRWEGPLRLAGTCLRGTNTDGTEAATGTNPHNGASLFRGEPVVTAGRLLLTWPSNQTRAAGSIPFLI